MEVKSHSLVSSYTDNLMDGFTLSQIDNLGGSYSFTRQYTATGIQPACYSYDDADRMTSLHTFCVDSGDISSDPSYRTGGDTTTWSFDDATGLELSKTNADASVQTQSYDNYKRLATITSAGAKVTTQSYNKLTAELLSVSYSDEPPTKRTTYNFLGQVTSITDASATHHFTYNEYCQAEGSSQEVNRTNFAVI